MITSLEKNIKLEILHSSGVRGSALACRACKSSQRPGFEFRVKQASQFKKSQTAVSTTERHFILSVVCLIVECTKDSIRVTKKNIQIVVGWLGQKWIERSILKLLLLKQNKQNYYYYDYYYYYYIEKIKSLECKSN